MGHIELNKFFSVIVLLSISLGGTEARTNSEKDSQLNSQLGTSISHCQGGKPLWMSEPLKTPDNRDVFRAIAESSGFAGTHSDLNTNSDSLEEKLKSFVSGKRISCMLTLRPSGRIESVKILKSSGDARADKQDVEFLRRVGFYGKSSVTSSNLSYEVELPVLRVNQTEVLK